MPATSPTATAPLKPGRKLDPTLPLTVRESSRLILCYSLSPANRIILCQAARLAQRAFRARKIERESDLKGQLDGLQSDNQLLRERVQILEMERMMEPTLNRPTQRRKLSHDHHHSPSPSPYPPPNPIFHYQFQTPHDHHFVSSFCPIPYSELQDPTPYIDFCLALVPSLSDSSTLPQTPPSPPLPPSTEEEECCGGLIDCSGPLFDDAVADAGETVQLPPFERPVMHMLPAGDALPNPPQTPHSPTPTPSPSSPNTLPPSTLNPSPPPPPFVSVAVAWMLLAPLKGGPALSAEMIMESGKRLVGKVTRVESGSLQVAEQAVGEVMARMQELRQIGL
ncbi:hypothetical protein P7C70_g2935, partial [Phenoliferia sp. Uapishka_3]